jgi:WD40 repeat protein
MEVGSRGAGGDESGSARDFQDAVAGIGSAMVSREGARLTARMRDGIADAVRASGRLRAFGPSALVSFLVAAAFVPFLGPLIGHGLGAVAEGELGAALNQIGAMGGGYLADVLTKAAERMRREGAPKAGIAEGADSAAGEALALDGLRMMIQEALEAPDEAGAGLRAGVSEVLRQLDAVKVALAADRDNVLAPGFAELGEQMSEFRWVLGDVQERLAQLRQLLASQGAHQRVQMRSARASLDTITSLLQRMAAASEHDKRPGHEALLAVSAMCPYPGMRPFGSRDAKRFFGREELTAHLVGRLAEQSEAGAPLVVLGPSGAGKSSLLRAGLIPALRQGLMPVPGSARWRRIVLDHPGAHPLAVLARAMTQHGDPAPLPVPLDGQPEAVADALVARTAAARAVVIVDQFEDVFTQCADETERLQFIRVLLALARRLPGTGRSDAVPPALLVLGLRADFYQDCANVAELASVLPDNQVLVGALSEPDLRRAIIQPATAAGVAVEPGLTELLLADLGVTVGRASYEPGALPLLGYALQATWHRRSGAALTVAAYQEAGGIHGAVAREAEQIISSLPPPSQAITRGIMLRLVNAGPGTLLTRRRVSRADLLAGLEAAAAEPVVGRFTQARLVTADAGGVEITHDAFLSAWPRLREWITDDFAGLRLHRQVGADARTWAAEGRDPGGLYRGVRLANAAAWRSAEGNDADLTALEREFLDASSAADQAEESAQEHERLRERQQNRRLRVLAASLAVVLAAALATAGFAVVQRQHAQAQRDIAQSEADAARSDSTLSTNLSSADLYALAAWQAAHTTEARNSLLSREADPYLGSFKESAQAATSALAVSPDGRLLAVGTQPSETDTQQASVQIWDLAARRRLAIFPRLGGTVQAVSFSPDGKTLAAVAASVTGNLRFWDVATHRALPDPIRQTGAVSTLAYSPEGNILAVAEVFLAYTPAGHPLPLADAASEIDLWDLASHRLLQRLTGLHGEIMSLAFSPGGRLLASGGQDGTARLWNVATGTRRAVLRGQAGIITSVVFSPDGIRLASVSSEGSDWVWNIPAGTLYAKVTTHLDTAGPSGSDLPGSFPAVFSPGSQYLSVGELQEGINRYNLVTLAPAAPPMGIQRPVADLAASSDGSTLIAAGLDGSLFMLGVGRSTFYEPQDSALSAVPAVSPDGRLAATGAADGSVELWPVSDPSAVKLLLGNTAEVTDVAFSPSGRLVAAIGSDCTTTIWNAATGRRLATVTTPGDYAHHLATGSLAFSPDGKSLAAYCSGSPLTGTAHATAILWNSATFHPSASFQVPIPNGAVNSGDLSYDPDGRTLALTTSSGTVLLWSTVSHQLSGSIHTGQQLVQAVAFSPDGKLLATAGRDQEIKLWNVARHTPAGVIGPETSQVHDLAFSPDGSVLAAASEDSTVRLWSVRNQQPLASLTVPTPEIPVNGTPMTVNGITFGPGGQTVVSANSDGTAQVWNLSPSVAVRGICAALRGPALARQWRTVSSGPNPCAGS